jgi:hypothetical protein
VRQLHESEVVTRNCDLINHRRPYSLAGLWTQNVED